MMKWIFKLWTNFQIELMKMESKIVREETIQQCYAKTGHDFVKLGEKRMGSNYYIYNVYQCRGCGVEKTVQRYFDIKSEGSL